ncbi:succinate dehydrogenase assembly factor 2 [Stappia sp. ES.058]|uniref:FAD assembly factor SdhE n=1 Tax=Stappia sp. ES.058 TaxID=1881061 RepID=UPI00087D4FC1|nr:succinate dehydrogenase assembly factor 2 [Stappia sp. ES.058]SDU10672.1 antitoxin CptB [Stappia sp. ES.058]
MPDPSDQTARGAPDPQDARRKRMLFRCQHRGMKEMDILLGNYAKARLNTLCNDDLDTLERLMDVPDQDLFSWMIGSVPVPANYDTPVYRAIVEFQRTG